MNRLLSAVALCLALSPSARAQEPAYRDDLRFAEALRARGDNDLALEYLKVLEKGASPELAKELPLELAKTRLRVAGDEPETGKRLLMYKEARDDFERFINGNAGHPRIAEAILDIARVLNLQGKTELNRAFLAEDDKSQKELSAASRATLVEAGKRLKTAAAQYDAILAKMPEPDAEPDARKKKELTAARARVDNDLRQTQLDIALNYYDQSETYIGGADNAAQGKLLDDARTELQKLVGGGDPKSAATWKARAWLGRVFLRTDTETKAHDQFQQILAQQANPVAAEGVRLARFFRMLAIEEKPRQEDQKQAGGLNAYLIRIGDAWRSDYARFRKTPEGYGLSFLLANVLLKQANTPKQSAEVANGLRTRARALLRELESSENEYTERARRKKLSVMAELKVFDKKIENLKTFEDCYVRAQYEAFKMSEDTKDLKDPKNIEEKRKARVENILKVLAQGLALPEVKKIRRGDMELNNARSMFAFWSLNTGKLDDAIATGEGFARGEPGASQAEMASVYALQGYGRQLAEKGKTVPNDADAARKQADDLAELRAKMLSLATFMENTWPRGMAGDLARHTVGLQLINDKEPNLPEAIKKLSLVGPTYGNYTLVCRLTANAARKADDDKLEPIPGDAAGDYRKRAVLALQSMPESVLGPDAFLNLMYVGGKSELGRELFRFKRFQQMDDLAAGLLPKIDGLRFDDDDEKNAQIKAQFKFELVGVRLYARYGLADQAYVAKDLPRVMELLDPVVDATAKADSPERTNFTKNPDFGRYVLMIALRANIESGKVDRTEAVLNVMDSLGEGGAGGGLTILKLLAGLIRGQIDDMRRKDDAGIDKAIEGYTAILTKRVEKEKAPTVEFRRLVADCYSAMEKHEKASEILEKIPLPTPPAPLTPEDKVVLSALIRELRRSGTKENVEKGLKLLAPTMEPVKDAKTGKMAPGFGMKELPFRKELPYLWQAQGDYGRAFEQSSTLVKLLVKPAESSAAAKEQYLECYFNMILCAYKFGLAKGGAAATESTEKSATQIAQFEGVWEDFGSDASKKRFAGLLAKEEALNKAYEAAKAKIKAREKKR